TLDSHLNHVSIARSLVGRNPFAKSAIINLTIYCGAHVQSFTYGLTYGSKSPTPLVVIPAVGDLVEDTADPTRSKWFRVITRHFVFVLGVISVTLFTEPT
ncbi:hypothetical protein LCGC14_3168530, partial [marine sediment metagenome]